MRALAKLLEAAVVVVLLPLPVAAQLQSVHVEVKGAPGKGSAVSKGLDCFVITAAHVVEDPVPISVIGAYRKNSSATKVWSSKTEDLAVLKVERPAEICGPDYYLTHNLAAPVTSRQGVLRVRNEDGTEHELRISLDPPTPVRKLTPLNHFEVYTEAGKAELGKGYSGGVVYIAGLPAGILTSVFTSGPLGADVLRIAEVSRLLASVVPLARPDEETAKFDDQLAGDLLRKSMNYVRTPQFCRDLWQLGKTVARREGTQLESTTRRTSFDGGIAYDINSLLIPSVRTISTISGTKDRENVNTTTLIGIVPRALSLDSIWPSLEQAIDSCLNSDMNRQVENIRIRTRLSRDKVNKRSMWTLERTAFAGSAMERADVWLSYTTAREITLSVWRRR